jgi:hypothetical protein
MFENVEKRLIGLYEEGASKGLPSLCINITMKCLLMEEI